MQTVNMRLLKESPFGNVAKERPLIRETDRTVISQRRKLKSMAELYKTGDLGERRATVRA